MKSFATQVVFASFLLVIHTQANASCTVWEEDLKPDYRSLRYSPGSWSWAFNLSPPDRCKTPCKADLKLKTHWNVAGRKVQQIEWMSNTIWVDRMNGTTTVTLSGTQPSDCMMMPCMMMEIEIFPSTCFD